MGIVLIQIIIILLLILLNGFFALSEIAFIRAKKSHLKRQANKGNKKAEKALSLSREPSEMLSAIQIGITAVGVLSGAFGGVTIAKHIEGAFVNLPYISSYSESISILIVVTIITYLSLVVGELAPKQIALAYPEKAAMKVSSLIKLIIKITKPLIVVLSFSSTYLVKLLNIKSPKKDNVTEEDVKLLIAEGMESGAFEKSEQNMVENVFRLGNRSIEEFMTPQEDVIYFSTNESIDNIKKKISGSDKTTFLVYEKEKGNVIGAVEANDILVYFIDNGIDKIDLKEIIQPVISLDSDVPSLVAIERLRKIYINIAVIKKKDTDKIIGIISLHDILEAVAGEFQFNR
jgi:putative hemolysin